MIRININKLPPGEVEFGFGWYELDVFCAYFFKWRVTMERRSR